MTAARTRSWLLSALNGGAAITLLLVVLDRSPATRFPIADFGALFGSLLLFVLIPLGLAGVMLLTFMTRQRSSKGRRIYVTASSLFLVGAWIFTANPAIVLIGLWQPWPLSLKQGPDTDYARDEFRRAFGFEVPPSVSGVHARRVAIMGEWTQHIRFSFEGTQVVEDIVERLELARVTEDERSGSLAGFVRVSNAPASWWPAARVNGAAVVYVDPGTLAFARGEPKGTRLSRILWLDAAGWTVFYKEQRE